MPRKQAQTRSKLSLRLSATSPPRRGRTLVYHHARAGHRLVRAHVPLLRRDPAPQRGTPEKLIQRQTTSIGKDWIPEVSAGNYNPIVSTDWNAAGFLFVFLVILVFTADRLIKPRADIEDNAE